LKDNVEEALSDLEYLQLIDSLVNPPDLTVHKTSCQDSELSNSNNTQRSLEILEANIVSTANPRITRLIRSEKSSRNTKTRKVNN